MTSTTQPATADMQYLLSLATEIGRAGGLAPGQTMRDAIMAAHTRRHAFAVEMVDGQTRRARLARKALAADIYLDLTAREAMADLATLAR